MSVHFENVVLKIFAEFTCSTKKREPLKKCFDLLFENEYKDVIGHVLTRVAYSLFKIGCFHHRDKIEKALLRTRF